MTKRAREVEHDIARLGADLLVEAVAAIAEGRASETPQDESEATYAHKIEKTDGIIDWSRPARDIHNQIRGLHPWPHAYSDLQGERTILLRSEVERRTDTSRIPTRARCWTPVRIASRSRQVSAWFGC